MSDILVLNNISYFIMDEDELVFIVRDLAFYAAPKIKDTVNKVWPKWTTLPIKDRPVLNHILVTVYIFGALSIKHRQSSNVRATTRLVVSASTYGSISSSPITLSDWSASWKYLHFLIYFVFEIIVSLLCIMFK